MRERIYDLDDEGFKQRLAEVEAIHKERVEQVRQKIYDACQIIANEQPTFNRELDDLEAIQSRQHNVMLWQWWLYLEVRLEEAEATASQPNATEADNARVVDLKAQRAVAQKAATRGKTTLSPEQMRAFLAKRSPETRA